MEVSGHTDGRTEKPGEEEEGEHKGRTKRRVESERIGAPEREGEGAGEEGRDK